MARTLFFLSEFIKNPAGVAAVAPSSRALARMMIDGVEFAAGDTVVEYGPGTGSFTRLLAELTQQGVNYLGIERNPAFLETLRADYPNLTFVEGSAEDVAKHLAEHRLKAPKAIVSGLPLAAMPAEVRDRIVAETNAVLAPGGVFRQFSYVHYYVSPGATALRRQMKSLFQSFELSRPVFWNVPPAFVYCGTA